MLMTWTGPDRRIAQQAYEGPERRSGREPVTSDYGRPDRPPPGPGHELGAWLRQRVAPQTLIILIAFGSMTAVAHYRLERVELEVAEIRAQMVREVAALRVERETYYPRRGELVPELAAINRRLESIEATLERTLPRRGGAP